MSEINETINTLSQMFTEISVVECDSPLKIDVKGESKKPNLIVLNGISTVKDFETSKAKVQEGGAVAFTRGNSKKCDTQDLAIELYGDSFKVIGQCSKNGEYIVIIRDVLVYVKGLKSEPFYKAHDWATSKNKNVAPSVQTYNLKAKLKDFKPLEKPKKPIKKVESK